MLKFVIGSLFIICLASCSKSDSVITPVETAEVTPAAVFFKDGNISVANLSIAKTEIGIQVSFITLYEKNITNIEVLSGITTSTLCTVFNQKCGAARTTSTTYTMMDSPKAPVMYYAIRYTMANGDWAMSPIQKFVY